MLELSFGEDSSTEFVFFIRRRIALANNVIKTCCKHVVSRDPELDAEVLIYLW